MMQTLLSIDHGILVWIQDAFHSDMLTSFFRFYTLLGNAGAVWIILTICLMLCKNTRRIGVLALISLACNYLVNNVFLKNVVARIRPYETYSDVQRLIGEQTDFSFPSGHTGAAFSVAVVLFLLMPRKYGIPAMLAAVLMGFSRLYLGVHYPSDVLAGALIAGGIAFVVHYFAKKYLGEEHHEGSSFVRRKE